MVTAIIVTTAPGENQRFLKTDKKGKEIILSTTRVQNSAETFKKDTGTHLTINIIYPMSNIRVFMQHPLQVVVPKQTIQGILSIIISSGCHILSIRPISSLHLAERSAPSGEPSGSPGLVLQKSTVFRNYRSQLKSRTEPLTFPGNPAPKIMVWC